MIVKGLESGLVSNSTFYERNFLLKIGSRGTVDFTPMRTLGCRRAHIFDFFRGNVYRI